MANSAAVSKQAPSPGVSTATCRRTRINVKLRLHTRTRPSSLNGKNHENHIETLQPSTIAAVLLASRGLPRRRKLRLPAVISEHAVVQANKPIAIWGWAAPGEAVRVSVGAGNALAEGFTATAAADGRWSGELAPMKAGVACRIIVKTDKGESAEVADVLVGEVWLAGGQSNMSYLGQFAVAKQERGDYARASGGGQERSHRRRRQHPLFRDVPRRH